MHISWAATACDGPEIIQEPLALDGAQEMTATKRSTTKFFHSRFKSRSTSNASRQFLGSFVYDAPDGFPMDALSPLPPPASSPRTGAT
jgi:hypothetical protein